MPDNRHRKYILKIEDEVYLFLV